MGAVAVLKLAERPVRAESDAPKSAAAATELPVTIERSGPKVSPPAREGLGEGGREVMRRIIPPVFGMVLLIGVWALVAIKSGNIPGPDKTWAAAQVLFADPFLSLIHI